MPRSSGTRPDPARRADGIGPAFSGRARDRARPALSLDAIVGAAVALLDAGGAEALTFRRLAAELGVGVASLYWYVDSKDVLMDLALDRVLAEIGTDEPRGPDWQAEIRAAGTALYRVFVAHRWAPMQLLASRDRGPNLLRLWEFVGELLMDAGFSVQGGFDGLSLLLNHVIASAAQEAGFDPIGTLPEAERRARRREIGDFLGSLDPQRFPAIVASAELFATHDQAKQFADGLEVILIGLEATRRPPSARNGR